MLSFNGNLICFIDKEFWSELEKHYFTNPSNSVEVLRKIHFDIGRKTEYKETELFQFSKFYNYESLRSFDCIRKEYLLNMKTHLEEKLSLKNLYLSIFIVTKIYHEGCAELLKQYYAKFYKKISYTIQDLCVQYEFLKTLQMLIQQQEQQFTEISSQIDKNIIQLQNTLEHCQNLQYNIQYSINSHKNLLEQKLVFELNQAFFSNILTIVGPIEDFCMIEEFPSGKKVHTFSYYRFKFQADYNKNNIHIEATFSEKLFQNQKLKILLSLEQQLVQLKKYCHHCKKKISNQQTCKRRLLSPIPKSLVNTVQCGKSFCEQCLEQKIKKIQTKRLQSKVYRDMIIEKKQIKENNIICLSCFGLCQCKKCLQDILIKGLYQSYALSGGSLQKLKSNYYLFYRQKNL